MTLEDQIRISLHAIQEELWPTFKSAIAARASASARARSFGSSAYTEVYRNELDLSLRKFCDGGAGAVGQFLAGMSPLQLSTCRDAVFPLVRSWFERMVELHVSFAAANYPKDRDPLSWQPDAVSLVDRFEAAVHRQLSGRAVQQNDSPIYLEAQLIERIKASKRRDYDVTKLVTLCNELNHAWYSGAWYSVLFLARAIVDHIPPVFPLNSGGFASNFSQVASHYSPPANRSMISLQKRSFKQLAADLDQTLKKKADAAIHDPITSTCQSLSQPEVDFRSSIAGVLSEVAQLLEQP